MNPCRATSAACENSVRRRSRSTTLWSDAMISKMASGSRRTAISVATATAAAKIAAHRFEDMSASTRICSSWSAI